MNALSINIPANFIASCESTLKRYNAAKTDAERRAVFACRAFLRLRTGKKQRGRPGGMAAALWRATAL